MIEQFQKLDDLIVEHTQPPVRTMLRNQLSLTHEQVEAYQAASDRQDETLAAQAQEIERLMAENKKLVAAIEKIQSGDPAAQDATLREMLRQQSAARKRRTLHYE